MRQRVPALPPACVCRLHVGVRGMCVPFCTRRWQVQPCAAVHVYLLLTCAASSGAPSTALQNKEAPYAATDGAHGPQAAAPGSRSVAVLRVFIDGFPRHLTVVRVPTATSLALMRLLFARIPVIPKHFAYLRVSEVRLERRLSQILIHSVSGGAATIVSLL